MEGLGLREEGPPRRGRDGETNTQLMIKRGN